MMKLMMPREELMVRSELIKPHQSDSSQAGALSQLLLFFIDGIGASMSGIAAEFMKPLRWNTVGSGLAFGATCCTSLLSNQAARAGLCGPSMKPANSSACIGSRVSQTEKSASSSVVPVGSR